MTCSPVDGKLPSLRSTPEVLVAVTLSDEALELEEAAGFSAN